MFIRLFTIVSLLAGWSAFSSAQLEFQSFSDVNRKIEEIAQRYGTGNVLAVFDTDDTLLVLNQTIGSESWFEWQNNDEQCEAACTPQMKLPPGDAAVSVGLPDLLAKIGQLLSLGHAHPNEPEIPADLRRLQDRGISTIVLTARGFLSRDATVRQYTENGIAFSPVGLRPNEEGREYLPQITPDEAAKFGVTSVRPVNYTHGIINADGQHKGVMLAAWLRELNQHPKAIVFVDNESRQTNRVYSVFKDSGIDVTTIRYSHSDRDRQTFWTGDKRDAIAEWNAFRLVIETVFH